MKFAHWARAMLLAEHLLDVDSYAALRESVGPTGAKEIMSDPCYAEAGVRYVKYPRTPRPKGRG